MSDLKSFYDGFADALQSPRPSATPPGIDGAFAHRFAIYRNNVHRGLYDALAAAYPTVCQLVGEEYFNQLAQGFVSSETKRARSLALYGDGFAEFLVTQPVHQSLPYLSDVARLERARLEASTAVDAEPLLATALAGYEDQLEAMTLRAHAASRVVASDFPIHAIWMAQNRSNDDAVHDNTIIQRPEAVLLTRPAMQVEMRVLSAAQAVFYSALTQDRLCLGDACRQALEIDAAFDVIQSFAEILTAGAFEARFETPKGNGHDVA